jgi:hypothetical protein
VPPRPPALPGVPNVTPDATPDATTAPARRRALPLVLAACALSPAAWAQADRWQFGAMLDLGQTSRALALGGRDAGLQLGHSDLSAAGPLGRALRAQATLTLSTHDGHLEREVDEAYAETTALPGGLQLRAGRFASQVGALNARHPHADDFTERPLLHRAFLGGHYTDDGLRLNWTAPTPWFLMLGVEGLRGERLVPDAVQPRGGLAVRTFTLKTGADLGREHAFQVGLSHLRNQREAAVEDDHDHGGHDDAAHGDAHTGHGATFSGRRTWMVDLTWKWSPGGNPRAQQVRLGFEAARISGINRFATAGERHEALGASAVWRFDPAWEVGARSDRLRVSLPHGDHFDPGRLREHALMLAWKPGHLQTLRLQWTTQRGAQGFDDAARRTVQLQYVLGFGAHPAHAF